MIMLNAVYPTRFSKKGEGYSQLKEKIIQKQSLKPYRKILENALQGKYDTAEDMRKDLITILSNPKNSDDFPKLLLTNNLGYQDRLEVYIEKRE